MNTNNNEKMQKATMDELKEYERLDKEGRALLHEGKDGWKELCNKAGELANSRDWFTEVFVENGKKGVKDLDGTVIVAAAFDEIGAVYSRLYFEADKPVIVKKDGRCGLAKADGTAELLIPCVHDLIQDYPYSSWYVMIDNGKKSLVTKEGEVFIAEADAIYEYTNNSIVFKNNGKYGLYDICSGRCYEAVYDDVVAEPQEDVKFTLNGVVGCIGEESGKFYPLDEVKDSDENMLYNDFDL